MKQTILFALSIFLGTIGNAEQANYGNIELTGLARIDWKLNPQSRVQGGLVCNVNGPDGFVSIRSGPGTSYKIKRKLNRLAYIEVDTHARKGRWVKVLTADRSYSKNGKPIKHKSLHVTGWVHDNFLCSWLEY